MGALANAVALSEDATFRKWCVAAGAYQARLVILEPSTTPKHAVRHRLAVDVLVSPQILGDRLVAVVGTDPDVASKGGTTEAVGEALVLQKVGEAWTTLAELLYPAAA